MTRRNFLSLIAVAATFANPAISQTLEAVRTEFYIDQDAIDYAKTIGKIVVRDANGNTFLIDQKYQGRIIKAGALLHGSEFSRRSPLPVI